MLNLNHQNRNMKHSHWSFTIHCLGPDSFVSATISPTAAKQTNKQRRTEHHLQWWRWVSPWQHAIWGRLYEQSKTNPNLQCVSPPSHSKWFYCKMVWYCHFLWYVIILPAQSFLLMCIIVFLLCKLITQTPAWEHLCLLDYLCCEKVCVGIMLRYLHK